MALEAEPDLRRRPPGLDVPRRKVAFVGDATVGKTALVHRIWSAEFVEQHWATSRVDMRGRLMQVSGKVARVQFWDLPGGSEGWEAARPYLRDIDAAVLVYDVTRAASFAQLPAWLTRLSAEVQRRPVLAVVGTHADQQGERQVPTAEGADFALQCNAAFGEVSAKTGQNVQDVLQTVLTKVMADCQLPSGPACHTLSVRQLSDALGTSINAIDAGKSEGLSSSTAKAKAPQFDPNLLCVDTTEPIVPWEVDPIEWQAPLDTAYISNEVGDVEVAVLAALPRPALELLAIHLMANVRARGYPVTDFMDRRWAERWTRWVARQRVEQSRPRDAGAVRPTATVVRDGQWQPLPVEELLPGDVLRLQTGDLCPADVAFAEIDKAENLELSLATVSGVGKTAPRQTRVEYDEDCGAKNVGLMGATVVAGAGYAVITATGPATRLSRVLRQSAVVRRLPPPRAAGYEAAGAGVPLHFDLPSLQVNNRAVTRALAFLTTIVADREAVLVHNRLTVTHAVLGHDVLEWTAGTPDPAGPTTPLAATGRPQRNTLSATTLSPAFAAAPALGSLPAALRAGEAAAEAQRLASHRPPPRLYVGAFRLHCDDLPIGSMLRSEALDRLALAALLATHEPPSHDPVNATVCRWAQTFPFAAEVQNRYQLKSSCFFPPLNLYGSIHINRADPTEKSGLLLVHGVAHRVFQTSNHVLTSKGSVPMSPLQRELFQASCQAVPTPRDFIYGFAAMDVDVLKRSGPDTAYDFDVMELLKNAEGLCYLGAVVVKEVGRDEVQQGFRLAREMGIKVVLCSCDSEKALQGSIQQHAARQHEKTGMVYVDGSNADEVLTREFWVDNYNSQDVAVFGCDSYAKQAIVESLHVYNPGLAIAMVGASAFSLGAMAMAHFSIAAPYAEGERQCLVDGVPLLEFLARRADLVGGSLVDWLQCVAQARRFRDQPDPP
eukprot:EG_transcript_1760